MIPSIEIYSPNIIGEVIKRKTGVKERKGTVSDRGEMKRALIYKNNAANSRGSPNRYVHNNFLLIVGRPSIIKKSHNIGAAKSTLPKAISSMLICFEYFLVKRSVKAKKKAHKIENIIQIKSPRDY